MTLNSSQLTPQPKQRLVFVNRYFYPDHSATAQLLTDLARANVGPEFSVNVITSRQRYDNAAANLARRQTIDGVDIRRVSSFNFGRRNLAGRLLDYISFYITAAIAVWCLARRNDIVVATTDPPLLSVAIAPLVHLRRAKLVNWLHDLFPELAEELGGRRHFILRPLLCATRWLRNLSLRSASKNIALGPLMQERLLANRIPPRSIQVIQNWCDDRAIVQISRSDSSLRMSWQFAPDDFIVTYSGNLGRAHDKETVLAAMRHFNDATDATAKRVRFLFVGGGVQFDRLMQDTVALDLRNVVFKPYQPRDRLRQSLGVGDLHLTILRPHLEGLIVPSKFYGIAAAGRPIIHIGDPEGEIPKLLAANACGLSVAEGDSSRLIATIRRLAKDEALCAAMGKRARKMLDREFSQQSSLNAWRSMLRNIAQ